MKTPQATSERRTNALAPWRCGGVLLEPGRSFDGIAVKDPTVVYDAGAWHLFYTAIGAEGPTTRRSIGYVTAPRLDELCDAERHDLKQAWRGFQYEIAAPQVFYCSPLGKWVLVAQRPEAGPTRYVPVISLSDNIRDVTGWSSPRDLVPAAELPPGRTAIDFWIIRDGDSFWLFFSDQQHGVWAMRSSSPNLVECRWDAPQRVLFDQGPDWELHEAAHIYFVPALRRYRLYIEAFRYGGTHANHLERFIAVYRADRLPGPWTQEGGADAGDSILPEDIEGADGRIPGVHQVSHPEWIRRGADERLEIDATPPAIIQETIVESPREDYASLGWRLRLITPRSTTRSGAPHEEAAEPTASLAS